MKVLVVDHSNMLRDRLVGLLSELNGVEIIGHAPNAVAALDAVRELKPDLVTLDFQAIEATGVDVLTQIKQMDRAPVVIMLTNRTSSPYRKKCIEAGADFFLDKSTEFGKVREIVQGLLERST